MPCRWKQIRNALRFWKVALTCATLAKPTTGRGNTQFAAETAAITGESKSQVNRHLSRAEALGDDIDRLVGTSLD